MTCDKFTKALWDVGIDYEEWREEAVAQAGGEESFQVLVTILRKYPDPSDVLHAGINWFTADKGYLYWSNIWNDMVNKESEKT